MGRSSPDPGVLAAFLDVVECESARAWAASFSPIACGSRLRVACKPQGGALVTVNIAEKTHVLRNTACSVPGKSPSLMQISDSVEVLLILAVDEF